jgi:outer membrane protein assembly factor BamB
MCRAAAFAFNNFCLFSIPLLTFTSLSFSQPMVTLSLKSGPPTSNVLVSGSGFSAYAAIDIYFDTTDKALASADASGAFSKIPIEVPASALPGEHWVTAVQRSNDESTQTAYKVNTHWLEFGFTPDGKRYNPYENVLNPTNVGGLVEQWSFSIPGGPSSSSPAVVDSAVYIGWENNFNNLYAIDAANSAKLWVFNSFDNYVQSAPAVSNGIVYVSTYDGPFYALSAKNGDELWTFTADWTVNSSPTVANGIVYFGSEANGVSVYALNANTGALLWSFVTGGVGSTPAVANGVVYIGSYDHNVYALNAKTGAELWGFDTGAPIEEGCSPAVADGVVYIVSGNYMYALNAASGAQLWNFNVGGYGAISSPAVANGVVYIGSYGPSDSNVYALNAATGTTLWSFTTHGSIRFSSAAVADGVVYIGSTDDNVYALNANTGAELWRFTTGGWVVSSPAVVNGVLYIGSNDGYLYAFSLADGRQVHSPQRPPLSALRPDLDLAPSQPVPNLTTGDYTN